VTADLESASVEAETSDAEPLDAWHERRGAVWRDVDGRRTVASYGDAAGERSTLAGGCGLIETRWLEPLEVSGTDRHRFLNAYLTCDVGALASGAGTYGFFTSTQGRVLADAVVSAGAEVLDLDVPASRAAALAEHLQRYILADRVTVRRAEERVQWQLLGPLAPDVVGRWVAELPIELWASTAGTVAGRAVALRRDRPFGEPVFSLRTAASEAAAVADELTVMGCVPVGFDAVEGLRVEAGVPRFGADFDEANFPQEVGIDDAVSYTKGCYLGQEVVARIHYRGHVNYELRALRIEGAVSPASGSRLEWDDQEVGRLGSVARAAEGGEILGLALIHRKAAAVGTRLSLADGIAARVELPGFARAAPGPSIV
jgi:folate-binding protein YgfZ